MQRRNDRPRPVVIDLETAAEPGGPVIHESWGDNLFIDRRVKLGDVDAAFAQADLPPEVLKLARIKQHMRERLHDVPNYTCSETPSPPVVRCAACSASTASASSSRGKASRWPVSVTEANN